ncbi:MAG: KilA-N domain-containing protein [Microcoleus sp.]
MSNNIVPTEFTFASTTVRDDGLVNATALTTAYRNATGLRKDCAKWLKTQDAEASIAYLARATQKCVAELVIVENGVGTWLHPDLAEIFAQWISVEYRFAVVALIRREKEQTLREVASQPVLPPSDLALKVAQNIRGITDLLDDNPRLAQVLIDCAMNEVVAKALPAPQLRGVAEIANEMGFNADASNRVKLGNFIKSRGFEPQKEKRLCNGVMTAINCYADTPTLRDAIADYFEH